MEYEYNLVAAKGLQLPKRISYLTVATNETNDEWAEAEAKAEADKKKKSRGDGRTPASRGGHASCRETTNGQRSAALLSPWMCMLCTCMHRACTVYCLLFARQSQGT